MNEFFDHRSDHGGAGLHVWGYEIPVYLFLGGLVAGLMMLGGTRLLLARRTARQDLVWTSGPLLGLLLLSLGMLALFLDLGHKVQVWRLYVTFQITSPMSWGSWILLAVYPALAAHALLMLPGAVPALGARFPVSVRIRERLLARPRVVAGIAFANIALGAALGIYTGLLLGTLGARPLWASAALGPLFLFSGLSTAAALLHALQVLSTPRGARPAFTDFLLARLVRGARAEAPDPAAGERLVQADNSFLTVEVVLLGVFLLGHLTSDAVHREAVGLLLTGPYATVFWVFVVGLGIALPLVLQHLELLHRIRHTLLPSLLVLQGGLVLRFLFVGAGQASHWSNAALR
ncbi:MAG: NrfD/PsrC family molybdoenzyme membrane anchor subunit [Planctomycetota bacterium]